MYQINKRKIKYGVRFYGALLSFSFCFSFAPQAATKTVEKDNEKLDKTIKDRVAKRVSVAMRKKRREQMKDILYPPHVQQQIKRLSSPFKLPNWPFYSIFFDQRDIAQATFSGSYASESFNSRGRSKDISDLVFKLDSCNPCIRIQDILLVSKLAAQGKVFNPTQVCPPNNTPVFPPDADDLKTLASQSLLFDGSVTRFDFSLNFARHFLDGKISLGCMLPFAYRHNRLKLKCSDLDPDIKAKINAPIVDSNGSPVALERTFAHMSLQQILTTILKAKGIDACRFGGSETGIGDVTTFLNYEIDSDWFERCVIGLAGIFPTARDADVSRLWDATTGNGGFYQMKAFASMLWHGNRFFNPHVHCSATYGFSGSLYKPVPKSVEYNGILADRGGRVIPTDLMELAENVILKDGEAFAFNTLDVCIGQFARTCKKIRFNPGPEFLFKLGNMFEQVFCERGFLDVYYDLSLRGKDYIGDRKCIDRLNPSFWTRRTWHVGHKVGFDFSYQFDHQVRLMVGGLFTVAGRNIEKTYEGHIKLNIEF